MDKAPTLVLRSLEGLRLVASLGIIVYHFVPYASGGLAAEDRLALFVDLFFVISGVVIAHAYTGRINSFGDYRDFLQKRVARLYPLHLATLDVTKCLPIWQFSGEIRPLSR
jgi:peptidoglycan/LPS O-acetylase OafA/YrhL